MDIDEVVIGPLHFEYEEKQRYLGISDDNEIKGTAEISPELWQGFADAAGALEVPTEGLRRLRISGHSDDLIEIEGDVRGADEYNTEKAVFEVAGLRIALEYAALGVWETTVTQIGEDVAVTAERVRLTPDLNGYSLLLELDVPKDAYVTRVHEEA